MAVNIMWNRKPEENTGGINDTSKSIGAQVMDYVHSMREEGKRGESKEAYAARVYAKARSGQKLSPDEMSFLARTNPALYQKVLRAQIVRKALENKLKSCRSKEEAQEVFTLAVSSISQKDPDRDMLVRALTQAFEDFKESTEYKNLPEKKEDEEKNSRDSLEMCINNSGYQEVYMEKNYEISFNV